MVIISRLPLFKHTFNRSEQWCHFINVANFKYRDLIHVYVIAIIFTLFRDLKKCIEYTASRLMIG